MGRSCVEYNGKWACFSSINDEFITKFVSKQRLENWRRKEYGRAGYRPIDWTNTSSMDDAIGDIRRIRNTEDSIKCLRQAGISKKESVQLVHTYEDKHYTPTLKNANYTCPNCGRTVKELQERCGGDDCSIRLIWRNYK